MISNFIIHGTALNIFNLGVLFIGDSAVGKSELALNLIDKGHQLIADDSVLLTIDNQQIIMQTIYDDKYFMFIRDLGFINIVKLYNHHAVCHHKQLSLIIELVNIEHKDGVKPNNDNNINHHNIDTAFKDYKMYDCLIKKITLLTHQTRNLCLLVETIVKYYIHLINGYDAHLTFIDFINQAIE